VRNRFRRGAAFVDPRQHCRPLTREERARVLSLAESLERSTRPKGGRNGVVSQPGLRVLRCLVLGFQRAADGLCCPSIEAIQKATGLARSTVCEALARLERCGIIKRVRRLARRIINFGGLARLTTVQTSNLYSFGEPHPTAHLLPTCKPRRSAAARLLSNLAKSLSFRAESAFRPETTIGFQNRGEFGGAAAV